MAEAQVTTDHGEITKWVEDRDGYPARVKGTEVLRIDYPGFSGEERLERITWEEFFEVFDDNGLAFLYQDETKDGKTSRFSKIVDRDTAKEHTKAAGKS